MFKFLSNFGELISGVISTIGNLIGVSSTNSTNTENVQSANAANRLLAHQQNQFNVSQWNQENAYNSPEQQMARFRAAGLNPSLVYGQQNLAGNSPNLISSVAPMQAPQNIPFQTDPLTLAQIRKLNADAEKTEGDNKRADEQQGLLLKNLSKDIESKDSQIAVQRRQISSLDADDALKYAQVTSVAAHTLIDQQVADKQCELWNSTIAKQDKEALIAAEEYSQLVAFRTLREENLQATNAELWSRIGVNKSNIDHMEHLNSVYDKQVEFIGSQTKSEDAKRNFEYSPDMIQIKKGMIKNQKILVQNQAQYWYDFIKDPKKYRTKSNSQSFGIGNSHYSHSESN